MKLLRYLAAVLVTVVATCAATPAFAQQGGGQAALKRKGDIKTWVGAGLMGVGAFTLPGTVGPTGRNDGDPPWVGIGLLTAGGGILLWGFQDKRNAVQPNTTVGVTVGRTSAVQIRRSW